MCYEGLLIHKRQGGPASIVKQIKLEGFIVSQTQTKIDGAVVLLFNVYNRLIDNRLIPWWIHNMATFLKGWRKDAVLVNTVCDQIWNLLRDMLWHMRGFLGEINWRRKTIPHPGCMTLDLKFLPLPDCLHCLLARTATMLLSSSTDSWTQLLQPSPRDWRQSSLGTPQAFAIRSALVGYPVSRTQKLVGFRLSSRRMTITGLTLTV